MAKILYGLCSVGIGHAVRSRIILEHLVKKNNVLIITSGNAYDYLSSFFPGRIADIEGFELAFENNAIANLGTLAVNAKKISSATYDKLQKSGGIIDAFKPEIVVSDWEPLSSMYAHSKNIPLVSIDNQHYLIFGEYKFPKKYWFQYLKARAVLQSLMRKSDYYIITLLPGNKLIKKNGIYGTAPIIRSAVSNQRAYKKDYVLVYQSTKSYDKLVEILKNVNEKFIVYGFDKGKKEGNLVFKRFNTGAGFARDLAGAKAVIANGGFTLISEAIYLRKPLLVVPIKKHFEQILNALYVAERGYGEFYEDLDEKSVSHFLMNLEKYNIKRKRFNGAKRLVKLIDGIIEREAGKI